MPVGVEARPARLAAPLELDERAFLELGQLQLQTEEALDDLERELCGGEEDPVLAGAEPNRSAHAARDRNRLLTPLVDPGGRHRAPERLERFGCALAVGSDGEDRLGIDGHPGLAPRTLVLGEQLVVVEDDSVVDADHRAMADRMVVRSDGRMSLGVVADVDEDLRCALRNGDLVEKRARAGALLVHGDALAGSAVRVADGVGAALGDSRQQSLGCKRPLECARGGKAVSGNSAHISECRTPDGRSSYPEGRSS